MTLELTTAGESHGPALVAILTGLPAGLVLERERIDADLARRQQGYGRSPRQQLEQDRVDVLAGLRHGRTLGTPLALVVANRDHANWEWGMNPWPAEGEPSGKGTAPVTLPRPGHADLAGSLKYGLADTRDALERGCALSHEHLEAVDDPRSLLAGGPRRGGVRVRKVDERLPGADLDEHRVALRGRVDDEVRAAHVGRPVALPGEGTRLRQCRPERRRSPTVTDHDGALGG